MPRSLVTLLELFVEWKDRCLAREIERTRQREALPAPDAILALSYRKYPLLAAQLLAKQWGVPWIADCRDIVEQYSRGDFLPRPLTLLGRRLTALERWIGKRYIEQRNRAIATAHTLITVSRWHREVLRGVHPSVRIIYNGYDEGLFRLRQATPTDRLRIVYTGRILSLQMRDPSLIFEVLGSERLRTQPIDLIFYTDDHSARLLERYNIDGSGARLEVRPMVSAQEVPDILADASLILLLGNEERAGGPHGMLSTKLFEAMAMRRPLVLLPDTSSETAEVVRQSGLGIATNSPAELEEYLLALLAEWRTHGTTTPKHPNLALIERYTRARQAAEFAALLSALPLRDTFRPA